MTANPNLDQLAAAIRETSADPRSMSPFLTPVSNDFAEHLREQLGDMKPGDIGAVLLLASGMAAGFISLTGIDSVQNVAVVNILAIAGEHLYTGSLS